MKTPTSSGAVEAPKTPELAAARRPPGLRRLRRAPPRRREGPRSRCAPRLKPEGGSGGGGRRGRRGLASGGGREEAAGGGEAAVARLSDRLRCPWVPRARLARSRHPAINSGTGRGGAALTREGRSSSGPPASARAVCDRPASQVAEPRVPLALGSAPRPALRSVSQLRDCGKREESVGRARAWGQSCVRLRYLRAVRVAGVGVSPFPRQGGRNGPSFPAAEPQTLVQLLLAREGERKQYCSALQASELSVLSLRS